MANHKCFAGDKCRCLKWPEIRDINDYVALLGGLSMVTRGLGFLVVTWTTVVLLGGFVSVLQKKDFWSLTVITFIELAGVVDNFGGDKWNSVAATPAGMGTLGVVFTRRRLASTTSTGNIIRALVFVKEVLGWIAHFVQACTFMIVFLAGHFGIFRWGMYVATGVSLWRLKQHDYGNTDGDSNKANMKPSLDVLYIIVVVQGAISVYRRMLNVPLENVVGKVAKEYGFKGPSVALVKDYMIETRRGCGKNPSFAKGRNLVTYAVDLMGPEKSPQECLCGLKILSTILGTLRGGEWKQFVKQHMLIRQLILYAPSSHIFRHLLVLSNPRSRPYGTEESEQKEMRKHAARIVAHMADGAGLEQLPQVIQCICSLLCTFQEYQQFFSSDSTTNHDGDDAEWKDHIDHSVLCLRALVVLADDRNNCRLIIHTRGLLTKIMMPLAYNLNHQDFHAPLLLGVSLQVLLRLTAAYGHGGGETQAKLFREIETNLQMKVVESMMNILRCDICSKGTETLAMGIVANLHMQMQPASREDFIEKLADMYTYTRANSARIAALEALATLCSQDGHNAAIILQVNGSALYSFTEDLEALSEGYQTHHISVAEILRHACLHYTRDDECFSTLKESMTDVMPKVLKKILTAEATSTGQQGGGSQNNGQNRSSSSLQKIQKENIRIETVLLSLCVTVHETFISADQYLALRFDGAIRATGLLMKLRGLVVRNSDPTASCLKILKLTSKMVISMMKCRASRYPKQDLKSLLQPLNKAFNVNMLVHDFAMDFARSNDVAKPRKPDRTLGSFLKEADELFRNYA